MVLDDHRRDSFAAHPEAGPKVLANQDVSDLVKVPWSLVDLELFAMQIYGEPFI